VSGHALAARSASTAAGLLAAIGAVAVTVRLTGASSAARGWLAFEFSRPPATPTALLAVAAGNLRLAVAVLLAALLVGLRPAIRPALDVVMGALAGVNATAVGVALAAYGTRLLGAAAHAPLELAAFAVAGGAYLNARRPPLDGRQLIAAAAASSLLLTAAAVLETYVQLGAGP
jgi:hypothetical protein